MELNAYRNNYQVLQDILIQVSTNTVKTHIVYKSNTNFKILKEYLEYAKERGLVLRINDHWVITDKGREFVLRMTEIESILKGA